MLLNKQSFVVVEILNFLQEKHKFFTIEVIDTIMILQITLTVISE